MSVPRARPTRNDGRRRARFATTRTGWAPIVLLLMATVASGLARAQQARSGGSASTLIVEQLQQLATERTDLQAQNAKLQKDLDDLRKERDALKSGQQALQRRAEQAAAGVRQAQQGILTQRQANDQELASWRTKLGDGVAAARKVALQLQAVESDRSALRQTSADRDRQLQACVVHNKAMYELNAEILTHFEKESWWSRLAVVEPVTRIKRTQLENLIDDYAARAQEQRMAPSLSAAVSGARSH
jgi:hypothetical protein